MKKFLAVLFVITLCLLAHVGFSQAPEIVGPFTYRNIYVSGVLSLRGDTVAAVNKKPWQLGFPDIAVVSDSTLLVWSVALQRYVVPRVASAASVSWPAILGTDPRVNTYLAALFDAKQNILPSGDPVNYIGGDHFLHNLDSFLTQHGWVNKIDSVFTTIQSGSVDSLNFNNGVYRTGNNVYAHYEWPIWNANRIQSFFIEALANPRHGYFLGMDSLAGVVRWMRPDSVVGGGSTPTLQQVFNTEVGGSVLTKTDTISVGTKTLKIIGTTTGNKLEVQATSGTALNAYASTGYGAVLQSETAGKAAFINASPSGAGIQPVMTVYRSGAVPAAGYGGGINMDLTSSAFLERTAIGIHPKWQVETDASRIAQLDITGVNNATDETFMNIQHDLVRINNNADTLSTKAYARSLAGGGGGGSSNFAKVYASVATVTTSGTSETDAYTYTIPANTLAANGDQMKYELVTSNGLPSGVAHTIRFYLNGTGYTNDTEYTNGEVRTIVIVTRTSSTTADIELQMWGPSDTYGVPVIVQATGLDWTISMATKFTMQAPTSSSISTYHISVNKQIQ